MKSVLCAAVLSLTLCLSCTTDSYDKGDGEYSLMRADMVELYTNGKGQVVRVVTDENEELTVKPFTVKWVQRPDTVYRAYLYYNIGENEVEPISAGSVSTLIPHRIEKPKDDPVRFESMWMSTSRRYLNMAIYLMVGETEKLTHKHVIGMHRDTLITNPDGKRALHLQFYHDQGGMPEYYSQRVFLSIPADSLDADTVSLRINTYNGVIEKRFILSSTQ